MRRLSLHRYAIGMLMGLSLIMPVQAERASSTDWYRWYRDLYGYLGSVGGILCAPGTDLQFHKDGQITAVSRDATCQASIEGLSYPLPSNAPVNQLSLTVRKNSHWPLSARALKELVNTQIARATTIHFP